LNILKITIKKNLDFTLAINQFGDLTSQEFANIYLRLSFNSSNIHPSNIIHISTDLEELPNNVDWRNKGAVVGVKNQGQCGSCWAFSAVGSIESFHAINSGELVSLSEQQLVDCDIYDFGCMGGFMDNAFKYVIESGGVDTEKSYPYQGIAGACHFNKKTIGAEIKGYVDVNKFSENDLKSAVAKQPVAVGIDASWPSFMFYKSGIYYEPNCNSNILDHGVLAIGYGVKNSKSYWLIKNSWGKSWGMNGYIMMSRNRGNNCGVASLASYPH